MADDLLRSVAAETVGVVGDAFLQRLVGAVGAALGADACWITEIEREHRVASWPPSGEVQPLDGRLSIDCPGTDGRPLARLVIAARSRPDEDELDVLGIFATRVGAELERRTHESRLRERENEIVVSRARVLQAADEERRRIGRNLHDGAQQRLVALSQFLGVASRKLERDEPEEAAKLIALAREQVDEAGAELRDLARGLHPVGPRARARGRARHAGDAVHAAAGDRRRCPTAGCRT